MSYRELYEFAQTLSPVVRRNTIRDRVLQITGVNQIKPMKTTLDIAKCRGFYLSARNQNHRIVQQHGCCVIVMARGMNRCWDRFVYVKELMHAFDDPLEQTDSGDCFELVLNEMGANGPDDSAQTDAEWKAFWMTLGVLCPEAVRQQLLQERAAGHTDDYAIALKLRIPQTYVRSLFDSRYEGILEELTA